MQTVFACVVAALMLASTHAVRAQTTAAVASHVIVLDQYMSPAAGGETLLAVQHLLAALEDRWLPVRVGSERTLMGRTVGRMYRTGKFLALDLPQDHFLLVVAHEVFGHGARFRELGIGEIRYGFDVPLPWGPGEAVTKFNGRFPASPLAGLAVSASGIEAQNVMADAIARRSVERGGLHYREAWLYVESRLAGLSYILSASPTSSEGHDVARFVDEFADACEAPCDPRTRKSVQRRAWLILADPMLYYAIYGFGGSYIGRGDRESAVPLISIGGMRLVPTVNYALAPYGDEWSVGALFGPPDAGSRLPRLAGASVRIGDTGARSAWAAAARLSNVVTVKRVAFGADVELWRQPHFLADRTSDPHNTGGMVKGTAVLPLPAFLRLPGLSGLHATAGYKSDGYSPGEQLSGGFFLRAGVALSR